MKAKGLQEQGCNHKPLFELIIEESRRKTREYNHHDHYEFEYDEGRMAESMKTNTTTNIIIKNSVPNYNNTNSSSSNSTSYNSSPASWCRSRSFNGETVTTTTPQEHCCMHSPDYNSNSLKKSKHSKISGTWFSRKSKAKAPNKAAANVGGGDNLAESRVHLNMEEDDVAWADLIPPISEPDAKSPSCLADGGEGYLEVAMALDMMELRLLQASMQRDAAVAEALQLRLAMDALSARLHYLERCCLHLLHLKPQLPN